MRGKDPYNFTDKIDSKKGKIAIFMSIVSFLWFLILIIHAVKTPLSIQQGLFGVYAFLLAVGAFFLALYSLQEEETKAKYKIIGIMTSGFVLLFCMAIILFI